LTRAQSSLEQDKANPFISQTLLRSRWPSPRATVAIAMGIFLLSMAVSLTSFLVYRGQWTVANTVLLDTAWAVALLAPTVSAVTAIFLTAREARSDQGQLVRLSRLPESVLARGYVFLALFRLRLIMAALVGLSPLLVVGMTQLHIRYRFATICYPGSSCSVQAVMSTPHIVGPLAIFGSVVIALGGLSLCGTALGVWIGLQPRKSAEFAASAIGPIGFGLAGLAAIVLARNAVYLRYDNLPTILAFVAPIWIPYALTGIAWRLTIRRLRAHPMDA